MASKPDRTKWMTAAAVVLSAVLFYFGTGFTPVWVLTWIAPLPVLFAAARVRPVAAWAAGAVAYLLGSLNSVTYYLGSHDVPLPIALVILTGSAALFGAATLVFRVLTGRGLPLLAALVLPAVWTAGIFLFSLGSPVGVIGPIVSAQADAHVVLQIAAVTGGWGVAYAVLLLPAGIAALTAPGAARRARIRTGVISATVVAVALGFGVVRLSGAEDGDSRTVALLVRDHAPWGSDMATPEGRDMLTAYLEQIASLPPDVDLVVLPEGAFKADDDSLADLVEPLSTLARERGTDIVVGLILFTGGGKYNTSYAVPADGSDPAMYVKWHNNNGAGGVTDGTELATLPGDPRVALANCMDMNFPDPAAAYALEGARLLAIPAADEDVNGRQHAVTGSLRGVENGMSTAWSAQRGSLLITDAYGRILAEDRTDGTRDFVSVVAEVAPGPSATPYSRLGDWFAWSTVAAVAAAVGFLALTRSIRGRRGGTGGPTTAPATPQRVASPT
ncbi:apolipoprotein N-acyltransferase [Stackebrandtia albiflava]|uniref:Apolipoprotein N-acyltransferase n=1 Tax=Stackebrandtia albiflava TaxID=406432 RepID=A0A562V3D3_9ACTN|nr:nitrilase-related carbon-nitrogen hydrolase [Stackebrandtia albiflava]TWJ12391.1 apolipoprotein N-acyltransferase [Stackebrandtia albiflava]